MKAPDINKALEDLQALKPPPEQDQEIVATKPRIRLAKTKTKDRDRKLIQVIDLWVQGRSFPYMEKVTGIPKATIHRWINTSEGVETIKKRGLELIDRELAKSALKDIQAQDRKRAKASFSELTIGLGTKIDKLRPPHSVGVNIDNRSLEVKFSKWNNNPFIAKGKKRRG